MKVESGDISERPNALTPFLRSRMKIPFIGWYVFDEVMVFLEKGDIDLPKGFNLAIPEYKAPFIIGVDEGLLQLKSYHLTKSLVPFWSQLYLSFRGLDQMVSPQKPINVTKENASHSSGAGLGFIVKSEHRSAAYAMAELYDFVRNAKRMNTDLDAIDGRVMYKEQ